MFGLTSILLLAVGTLASVSLLVDAAAIYRGSRRAVQALHATSISADIRRLQGKNNNNNNNLVVVNVMNGMDKNNKQGKDFSLSPSLTPTNAPSLLPTIEPTIITSAPTLNPTMAPAEIELASMATNLTNLSTSTAVTTAGWSQPEKEIPLDQNDVRDIQYLGGGEIKLRLSLKFMDISSSYTTNNNNDSGSGSNSVPPITSDSVSGPIERAVLKAMQQWLCQSPSTMNEYSPIESQAVTGFAAATEEERELCVVKSKLSGGRALQSDTSSMYDSILMHPPTTYVADRQDGAAQWTTWRLTWNVLRLGNYYIRQGLENMDVSGTTTSTSSQQAVYQAGVLAMQQVLDLALQVHIRDRVFDKVLESTLLAEASSVVALASVYGEEASTYGPQGFIWDNDPNSNNESEALQQTEEGESPAEETNGSNQNNITVDGGDEGDDEWEDDRYSDEFGITEPLNPPFWHPLRIVGVGMFLFTVACLVALTFLSRRRQKQREQERTLLREQGQGLLNNPQGLEAMLRLSFKNDNEDQAGDVAPSKGEDDDETMDIPMPTNLKMM